MTINLFVFSIKNSLFHFLVGSFNIICLCIKITFEYQAATWNYIISYTNPSSDPILSHVSTVTRDQLSMMLITDFYLARSSIWVLDSDHSQKLPRYVWPKFKPKSVEIGFKWCIASGDFLARLIRLSVRYVTLRVHFFDNI